MIPEQELQEVKESADILSLVRSYGLTMEPKGKDFFTSCPFHKDDTPSLSINPEKKVYHCFGCGEKGTVFQFVEKMDKVTFPEAVKKVAQMNGRTLSEQKSPSQNAIEHYHKNLLNNKQAIEYLKSRSIYSEEAVRHFKIGYADKASTTELKKLADLITLKETGLVRSSGHGHFNGCITFPINNGSEIYGRKVNDNLRPGTAYHMYLPGAHKGIWNDDALKEKEVILCESIIDALSFWVHGFKNVTASYGTGGFTDEMQKAFKESGIQKVFVAYDRDEAGEAASKKVADQLSNLDVRRVKFPVGMDANEFICQQESPVTALKLLLQTSVPLNEIKVPSEKPLPQPETEPVNTPEPEFKKQGEDYHITLGERAYRVRGLHKNLNRDNLKVNLRVMVKESMYVDIIEFYNNRHRETFTLKASDELGVKSDVIKKDLCKLLLKLEDLQDKIIEAGERKGDEPYQMSEAERESAMGFLKTNNLIGSLKYHLKNCGHIGEESNKLLSYLSATSRLMDTPLSILIQGSTGVGKTELMKSILNFMPEEETVTYSSMSGQSLYYMEAGRLKNKILSVAEETGAEKSSYSLKLLISEKKLFMASTGKDTETGKLITQEYTVEGPTMVMSTSTRFEMDPELMNRCLILYVNESRGQIENILKHQRFLRTPNGQRYLNRAASFHQLHQNVQRLLKPISVYNPYCESLTFSAIGDCALRNQMKYLNLINTIAFLHQYQRPVMKSADLGEYTEVTLEDIELANSLVSEVLGHSLDELPPQTRNVLQSLYENVKGICEKNDVEQSTVLLTRKQIRDMVGIGDTQLRVHLGRLVSMEYMVTHRGKYGSQYVYELLYGGEGDGNFLSGLIDVKKLQKTKYDVNLAGVNEKLAGQLRPSSGGVAGHLRGSENTVSEETVKVNGNSHTSKPETALIG